MQPPHLSTSNLNVMEVRSAAPVHDLRGAGTLRECVAVKAVMLVVMPTVIDL